MTMKILDDDEDDDDGEDDDDDQARANRAATYISLALAGALAVCLPRFFEVFHHNNYCQNNHRQNYFHYPELHNYHNIKTSHDLPLAFFHNFDNLQ